MPARRLPARWLGHGCAFVAYLLIAIACSWPLPLHLASHTTGPVSGDTGVYVWNLWVFRHEVTEHGRFPLYTSKIFSLTAPADLSLHNYTTFADLLAFPLLPVLGVMTTFNVVYLFLAALTGYAMFLLARHITGKALESWLAGAMFAFCPVMIARSTAHFSLLAAAPLPVFLLMLLLLTERRQARYAAGAGAAVAWAALSDVYYAVYCVLLAAWYLTCRGIFVGRVAAGSISAKSKWAVNTLVALSAAVVAAIAITGGTRLRVDGITLSIHALYTPVLVLTVLVMARLALTWRPGFVSIAQGSSRRIAWFVGVGTAVCALMLSPGIYAVGVRLVEGRWVSSEVYWRSSPPGVDLLAFFIPNPTHPAAPDSWRAWLSAKPGQFAENVASLPLTALVVILAARLKTAWRWPRFWTATAVAFALLALGPFIVAGGQRTYVPTPWALLRYVPFAGSARAPARFTIVVLVALAVLFAMALARLGDRHPRRRRLVLGVVAAALAIELTPAPRVLYSAEIPSIYGIVAADPRNVRVLELPLGLRDGVTSYGNFSAASQYYQTYHGKPLVGGYLSRISRRRVSSNRSILVVDALLKLSDGRQLDPQEAARLIRRGHLFVERAHVGYVVVDRARAPTALVEFARAAFGLTLVAEGGDHELYRTSLEGRSLRRHPRKVRSR